ncbi:MAG TPA: FeoA family protein [Victivallales bacterium]|nr:FeoA family protein [Victivallales bacterium]
MKNIVPLSQLKIGLIGEVAVIEGNKELRSRIVAMGISIGEKLRLERDCCFMNDSIIITVLDSKLIIAMEMAEKIMVYVEL